MYIEIRLHADKAPDNEHPLCNMAVEIDREQLRSLDSTVVYEKHLKWCVKRMQNYVKDNPSS